MGVMSIKALLISEDTGGLNGFAESSRTRSGVEAVGLEVVTGCVNYDAASLHVSTDPHKRQVPNSNLYRHL
jgi:hypothetical protein